MSSDKKTNDGSSSTTAGDKNKQNPRPLRKQAAFNISRIAYRRAYSDDTDAVMSIKVPTEENSDKQWPRLYSWFLGPKGENEEEFRRLACQAIERHCTARKNYFISDEEMVTKEIKKDPSFKTAMELIETELKSMSCQLEQSVPSFSPRYQGHMLWDTAMPANLGYIQALLYNQNNVALEASPVTTDMEITVCKQLCDMLFETCKTPEDESFTHWGHITSGGSIANIEAMWASRNVKFIPLAMQKILKLPKYEKAKDYTVYVPKLQKKSMLTKLKSWDLLNLNIDDIIKMPKEVGEIVGNCLENDVKDVMEDLKKYSIMELGVHGVMETFKLKNSPVIISPSTNHYSWPKAANILGLGITNMKPVGIDERARMDVNDLEKILTRCLEEKTPVISVVVVIGTTEESAVDPLVDVLQLRDKMRGKGLNFAINADAAWGGYFMTMLGASNVLTTKKESEQYVPYCDISGHTFEQLKCLHKADTVTVDPHKSGFIPYSAGAICYRNGDIKNFIKMEATVVAHEGEGDKAIGICAIQGSRPGAAAAGILMAHKTIGLDPDGYGRILGQCMYGAKLFYLRWLTLARDDDPFVVVLMKDVPKSINKESAKNICAFMFNSDADNKDIIEMSELRQMFRRIGPDMLINAFSVNIKGNKDIELCNRLNKLIYRMLSHSDARKDVQRTPLILTHSEVDPTVSPRVVHHMKERLGLDQSQKENLHFLINTVMNPFIGRPVLVEMLGEIFRDTVLTAIGTLTDTKSIFKFVCVNKLKNSADDIFFFAEFWPSFTSKAHQYQAVIKFKLVKENSGYENDDIVKLQNSYPNEVLNFETVNKSTLGECLEFKKVLEVNFQLSFQQHNLTRKISVEDILLFKHYDLSGESCYPQRMMYYMYGIEDVVYMTHLVSRDPDFFQILELAALPEHVSPELLHGGLEVAMCDIPGKPEQDEETNAIRKPDMHDNCRIQFMGENGKTYLSSFSVARERLFKKI